MPPLAIPPLVKLALGALGAGAVAHWVIKGMRHVNDKIGRVKSASPVEPARQTLPTLRRDPRTGEWRLM